MIIKLSSLGDVVFNIPLANCLKKNGYEVSWLVSEKGFDVLKNNPCVDKIFLAPFEKWKKNKSLLKNLQELIDLIKNLRKENFDIALDTQMRLKSLLFNRFCGAKRRIISKDAKEFSFLGANEFIPSIKENNKCHVVKGYLKYAEYLGLDVSNIELTFPPSEKEAISQVDDLLEGVSTLRPLVLIAPATTWDGKHWNRDNWKNLVKKLEKDYTLIFTGMKSDEELIKYIGGDKHLNLAGKTTLKTMFELLKRVDLLISLDSGTTHLGWATQNPKIVSIYCCTPAELYAPIGDFMKYRSVQSENCRPCHHKKCPLGDKYSCTHSPSVDLVYDLVKNLMNPERL